MRCAYPPYSVSSARLSVWADYFANMKLTYDAAKNIRNIEELGLSFERAAEFDFATAKVWQDARKCYPEVRFLALGYLDGRLHVLCFTTVVDDIRVISFRKANQREGEKHGFALTRN